MVRSKSPHPRGGHRGGTASKSAHDISSVYSHVHVLKRSTLDKKTLRKSDEARFMELGGAPARKPYHGYAQHLQRAAARKRYVSKAVANERAGFSDPAQRSVIAEQKAKHEEARRKLLWSRKLQHLREGDPNASTIGAIGADGMFRLNKSAIRERGLLGKDTLSRRQSAAESAQQGALSNSLDALHHSAGREAPKAKDRMASHMERLKKNQRNRRLHRRKKRGNR